ncbi:MAG: DUF58 domain-containing protein [Candidatus Dormibacteraeota bacterium]|uniref:DUF58 domain-containing protein n=1 Tax=Candidatus Dormiibacter inghamiae TaxID=3127013 RepID=A0A934N7I8_9BACT|nr:DUF58 domain-containing protein [Candidatus Dormibacteraeota bacterium]MBJ7607282.1 DUF58 domain-containing protein [Candidatus Dormibacteraeota bacterium]
MTRALLAAGIGVLLFLAYLTAIRPAFAVAYALGGLLLLAWAWPRLVARGIHLQRSLDAGRSSVGEPFEETFSVRKQSRLPAPWVEVQDLSGLRDYQPGRVVSLGKRPVLWTSQGVYKQRGRVRFGPTQVVVSEPFGLFRRQVRVEALNEALVYPRIWPLPELVVPASQHAGIAPRTGNWSDYPPESSGVRDYVAGDSFGRIHWPLSHKHGQLMSKTFEQPLTADVWVVLDLEGSVHHGEGLESTLEYAVSLAASLCVQVQENGRQVGLIATDDRGTLIEPSRTGRKDRALLDYFALCRADGSLPLARANVWEKLRRLPRRAVAVITPSADPAWLGSLQSVRAPGTALIVFYLDACSFGAAGSNLSFDLGAETELYVVRRGDDFSRLVSTRDAVRLV